MKIKCDLTEEIIGGAIEVHRTLGPGLLESVYGLLINFNVPVLKDGLKRMLNGFSSVSP